MLHSSNFCQSSKSVWRSRTHSLNWDFLAQYGRWTTRYWYHNSLQSYNRSVSKSVGTVDLRRTSKSSAASLYWYPFSSSLLTRDESISQHATLSVKAPHPSKCFQRLCRVSTAVSRNSGLNRKVRAEPDVGSIESHCVSKYDEQPFI